MKITKDEFCKLTHTRPDCWLFEPENMEEYEGGNFHKYGDELYFHNGKNEIYKFRDYPEYEEVWVSKAYCDSPYDSPSTWSMYTTWTTY